MIYLLKNPDATVKKLMKYVTAPDFPTGGIIYGYQPVIDAFETGRGKVILQAKVAIEPDSVVLPTEEQIAVVATESPSAAKAATNVTTPESTEGMKDVYDELFGLTK